MHVSGAWKFAFLSDAIHVAREHRQTYAVHDNLLFFPMQFIWPVNTDKMRFNTYTYIFLQQSLSRYCLL